MASNANLTDTPVHSTPIRATTTANLDSRLSRRELDPKRKYISSPEVEKNHCARCDNDLGTNRIECKSCTLPYCARCSGMSMTAFDLVTSGGLEDYNFLCKSCKKTMPTLENIDKKLNVISDQQERRLRSIEENISKIKLDTKTMVQDEMKEVHKKLLKDLEHNITKTADARIKEMDDRRRRELNIVVFNLPEGTSAIGAINKEHDENNVRLIAENLGLENLQIETSYRLGKKIPGKLRVLKVILKDRKERKHLLANSKNIKEQAQEKFKNVIIYRDLTEEQRKDRREKRQNKQPELQEQPNVQVQNGDSTHVSFDLSQAALNPFEVDTISNINLTITSAMNDETIIGGLRAQNDVSSAENRQGCE